ncbi:MAG: TrmH family RNA methyltransferase [Bacilli bacterium]|nr:TrmH family RNA methyltransferase [Bacilli bacterium]
MVKKYKKELDVSYTLGITLTIEVLKQRNDLVNRVFIHSKTIKNESFNLIEELCNRNNIPLIYNDKVFNILSNKENCFVIAEFRKYNNNINELDNHVVLVNPSNAGNLGTIMRSMVGFNLNDLVIITPAVDIFDPKCIRASMGAIFHINFTHYNNFLEYYNINRARHYYPFMLQSSCNLSSIDIKSPYSLIFGNEATGLDDSFLRYGNSVIIKHSNYIDSLNLPIAVSIGIYEFTKNKFK